MSDASDNCDDEAAATECAAAAFSACLEWYEHCAALGVEDEEDGAFVDALVEMLPVTAEMDAHVEMLPVRPTGPTGKRRRLRRAAPTSDSESAADFDSADEGRMSAYNHRLADKPPYRTRIADKRLNPLNPLTRGGSTTNA